MVAAVTIKKVVKRYDSTTVVHGIDIDVLPGEFMVLVGPSGCGKSTTLRMVAGLEEISGGEISIDGQVINHLAPKDRNVAMVFQNYALYPHLNVRDNMSFGLRLNGVKKDIIATEVKAAADILGLEPLLERKPSDLSGGQRQRVAMGRAIVRKPKVFLFDEPLSNLDAKLRTAMRAEIKRLHVRLGTTVIYVTHDQIEAMTLADRIVVMRDGYIEQIGTPMELFNHPVNTFVAGFIGSPPMNLFVAHTQAHGGGIAVRLSPDSIVPVHVKSTSNIAADLPVTFGVRPEDIYLTRVSDNCEEIFGIVEIVEPLGSEAIIHVRIGEHNVVVRASGREWPKMDARIPLYVDLARVHLFDAKTTASIY